MTSKQAYYKSLWIDFYNKYQESEYRLSQAEDLINSLNNEIKRLSKINEELELSVIKTNEPPEEPKKTFCFTEYELAMHDVDVVRNAIFAVGGETPNRGVVKRHQKAGLYEDALVYYSNDLYDIAVDLKEKEL